MDENQVIENIKKAFESLTGEEIATVHNEICAKKIKYMEDNVWEYTGKED